jgi:hypothetical protein
MRSYPDHRVKARVASEHEVRACAATEGGKLFAHIMCLLGNVFVLSTFIVLVETSIDDAVLNPGADKDKLPPAQLPSSPDEAAPQLSSSPQIPKSMQKVFAAEPVFVVGLSALTAWVAIGTEVAHTQWGWGYAQVRHPHFSQPPDAKQGEEQWGVRCEQRLPALTRAVTPVGSFLWYRTGLCQCRFRKGLFRAQIAEFPPAGAGLSSASQSRQDSCFLSAFALTELNLTLCPRSQSLDFAMSMATTTGLQGPAREGLAFAAVYTLVAVPLCTLTCAEATVLIAKPFLRHRRSTIRRTAIEVRRSGV